jgi:hypothetical protein
MLRTLLTVFCAVALLAITGCPKDPYFDGDGPVVTDVAPAWINGNLGGEHIFDLIEDLENLSEEDRAIAGPYIARIRGNFPEDECGDAAVQFGSRAVQVIGNTDGASIDVVVPPGPVRGGPVDVIVTCGNGTTTLERGFDYVLGDVREADHYQGGVLVDADGDRIPRLEPLHENEYASFALIYGAAPFSNQPDPVGYGFFFNQPAPRAANFYGGTAGFVYAGAALNDEDNELSVPHQRPQIAFEVPEQGDRIRAGSDLIFYRRRNTSDQNEPLTDYARKQPTRADLPDPCRPLTDGTALEVGQPGVYNRHAVWLGVPFDDPDGIIRVRFLRLGIDTGRVCDPYLGCSEADADCSGDTEDELNDTRLPLEFGFRWFEPDAPSIPSLRDEYPHAAPELLQYAECIEDGGEEDGCLDGLGIQLPTDTYDNAFLCRSTDESDNFPWFRGSDPDETFDDGICLIMETLGSIEIVQGATHVDISPIARARWPLNEDANYYDGFGARYAGGGENVLIRNEPVFVAYEQGFYRGDLVPAKNMQVDENNTVILDQYGEPVLVVPQHTPYPMGYACRNVDGDVEPRPTCDPDTETIVGSFDDTPYIEIPDLRFGTFIDAVTQGQTLTDQPADDAREFLGLRTALEPVLLPMPGEEALDWRVAIPGGATGDDPMDGGGWDDTYFVVTLEVRDLDRPEGLNNDNAWRASAFAFAGDDQIVIPAETLATLPEIADIFRPDAEDQAGSQYLGLIRMQAHRTATWTLSGEHGTFRDANGKGLFDISAEWLWYFHNQHSCYDGIDNDGDGLCDAPAADGFGRCTDEDGVRLEPDPACSDDDGLYETADCQDGEDNDEDGLIDAEDPDCINFDGDWDPNDITEGSSCSDDIDNDGDGWIDLEDAGCAGDPDGTSEGGPDYLGDCSDGVDEDGDGLIDGFDPGCEDPADDELGDTCSDGIDNNEDGWIDTDDLSCAPGADFGGEEVDYDRDDAEDFQCSDFSVQIVDGEFVSTPIDNDGDGLANADDPECKFGWDSTGELLVPLQCADRIDNDGDGWIDGEDAQCSSDFDDESSGLPGGSCEDGEDNDGDGWIDALDPDCLNGGDDEIFPTSPLQCNDGIDNDGDGDIDSADSNCPSGKDHSE